MHNIPIADNFVNIEDTEILANTFNFVEDK